MRILKLTSALILIAMIISVSGPATAAAGEGDIRFNPHAGYYLFEGDEYVDEGPTAGLGLGYELTDQFTLEVVLNYIDMESRRGHGDAQGYMYRLDGLYHFMPESTFSPYVAVGAGGLVIAPDWRVDDNDPVLDYGAGVRLGLTETIDLRLDVRHVISFSDTRNNLEAVAGLSFRLGSLKPKDSDKDGISDKRDNCNDTPAGARVDATGCPMDADKDGVYDGLDQCEGTPNGARVSPDGCPMDSDKDGVFDGLDGCASTPAGTPVGPDGCPLVKDSDGDGVTDDLDRCADTPAGKTVDANGCPEEKMVEEATGAVEMATMATMEASADMMESVVERGTFGLNSHKVSPEFKAELDQLAMALGENPTYRVRLIGHTCNLGTAAYNMKLSYKRADAVKAYLMQKGVSADRLLVDGHGLKDPLASNATEEGRMKNRRVEIELMQ